MDLRRRIPIRTAAVAGFGSAALAVGGCGQVSIGEQTPTVTATSSSATPVPTPGPDATEGCAELAGPVHRLVTSEGDTSADSELTLEIADRVDDNALSAVASRISGFVAQPTLDPVVLNNQWDQFRQLCDMP